MKYTEHAACEKAEWVIKSSRRGENWAEEEMDQEGKTCLA